MLFPSFFLAESKYCCTFAAWKLSNKTKAMKRTLFYMIIRNDTTKETATQSSLNNRGYERSEHPRLTDARGTCTLEECPITSEGRGVSKYGRPLLRYWRRLTSGGATHAPVIERRRFQRLGGTIADNHIIIWTYQNWT